MDQLVMPWRSIIALARANLLKQRYPDDTRVISIAQNLEMMKCSPHYPAVVAHNVARARELCAAGCLFYELFSVSIQFAVTALEVALKEKFIERLPMPCKMTRTKGGVIEVRTLPTRENVYDTITFDDRRWKFEDPFREFRPNLGYLLNWAMQNGILPYARMEWFDHGRITRNIVAHGHAMVVGPGYALGTLQQTTIVLNQMFPDSATNAYDKQVEDERVRTNQEWWRETEALFEAVRNFQTTPDDEELNGEAN